MRQAPRMGFFGTRIVGVLVAAAMLAYSSNVGAGRAANPGKNKHSPTLTATRTATPTATATIAPSWTPTATPTPGSGTSYYFSPSGSDSSPCSQVFPCWSLAKAQSVIASATPGMSVLFQRGGTWSGGITMPTHVNGTAANRIVISNYGSGALPIIDGGGRSGAARACFYARATGNTTSPLWSYLTIDGFECRNT